MNPLTVVIALTLALGGLVALALTSRGHAHPAGAGSLPVESEQTLARTVSSPPLPEVAPAAAWDVLSEQAPAPEPDTQPEPQPEPEPVETVLPTYADLARGLAEQGRDEEAAIARWAADLRDARPVAGHETTLADAVEDLDPTAYGSPRELLEAVRRAASVVVDAPSYAPSPLAVARVGAGTTARHLKTADPVTHQDPTVLRETARTAAVAAINLAATDAPAARAGVWEADLAAFDAVLIEAAQRGGDRRLASVRLRRHLAMSRLQAATAADDLDATTASSLPRDVARVRATLSDVLEPHERETLAETFTPWPPAHASGLDAGLDSGLDAGLEVELAMRLSA